MDTVSTLPIRNGNVTRSQHLYCFNCRVSTLPIRNGNIIIATNELIVTSSNSKYLTYKEWKHRTWILLLLFLWFCKYLTYKEWKLYLPFQLAHLHCLVSTLPIRNGNKYYHWFCKIIFSSKYLTYKEWKHSSVSSCCHHFCSKYLTYKEWKLAYYTLLCFCYSVWVSTLPIRNGNHQVLKVIFKGVERLRSVSTLPIRNGNNLLKRILRGWFFVSTLPIRNRNLFLVLCTLYWMLLSPHLLYTNWWKRVSTLPIRNGNSLIALLSARLNELNQ